MLTPRRGRSGVGAAKINKDKGLHNLILGDVDSDGHPDVVSCSDNAPLRVRHRHVSYFPRSVARGLLFT